MDEADSSRTIFVGLLDRGRVAFCCVTILVFAVVLLIVGVTTSEDGRTRFGPFLGADYASFHTAGDTLADEPDNLYDLDAQRESLHEVIPAAEDAELPFFYAPAIAAIFVPLSTLAFTSSYLVWVGVTGVLYVISAWLIVDLVGIRRGERALAVLVLLAFEPLVFEGWIGGQLSALTLLLCAGALRLLRDTRWFGAGVLLGLCAFKPPVLLLAVPAVLVMRRARVLAGVATGGAILLVVSTVLVGVDGVRRWIDTLFDAADLHSTAGRLEFRTWKWIDVASALELLGASTPVAMIVLGLLVLVAGYAAWSVLTTAGPDDVWRLVAVALALSVPLNGYVAVYDAVLILPALALALGAARSGDAWALDPRVLAAVWALPWATQIVAERFEVQIYTLALAGFGAALIALERRRRPVVTGAVTTSD